MAIGLGANLKDREGNLLRAAVHLGEEFLSPVLSPLVVSEPLDCPPDSPKFLNAVLVGLAKHPPDQLLAQLKALEHRAGRRAAGRNAPRVLDCDLLVHGRMELDREELRLPHPSLTARGFWTVPLAVVATDLPIPGLGTAAELVEDAGDVVWRPWSADSVATLRQAEVALASTAFTDC